MNIRPTCSPNMIPAIVYGALCIWLRAAYGVPIGATVAWGLAAWVFFYLPGCLALGFAGGNISGIRGWIHSLALGSALIVPVYALLRTMHVETALLPLGAVLIAWWAWQRYRLRKRPGRPHEDIVNRDVQAFAFLVALALLLLHFSFFTDVVLTGTGFNARVQLNETFFHLALANVMSHTWPPFYPFASDVDFSHYHLYMHLQIEMLNRITGVDTLLLTFFMMPMLYVFLILWLAYALVSEWLGSRLLGVAAGALMFCSNLAWIPGILGKIANGSGEVWEVLLTPTLFNLVVLNGTTPAIYVMLLALCAMREYFMSGSRRQLALFATLAYISYGFKSTMGLQLLALSIVTGLLYQFFCDEKRRGRDFALAAIVALAILAVNLMLVRKGMGNATVSFAPFGEYRAFLEKIGASGMGVAGNLLWPPVYLLWTFGARSAGLLMTRDIFRRNFDPLVMLLVLFSISGVVFAETITIVSPSASKNAAVSFSAQSLEAAWLLLPLWMARYLGSRRKLGVVLVVVFAVALPTPFQLYASKHGSEYAAVDRDETALTSVIKKTDPHAVFLYPRRFAPSSAAHLGGRQGVLDFFYSFAPEWAGEEEANRRAGDVMLFFNAAGGTAERARILKRYHVDYVYAPGIYRGLLDGDPMLRLVYLNGSYVMYRVATQQP